MSRRSTRRAIAGTVIVLGILACAIPAAAQDREPQLRLLSVPTISGTTVVGNLLTAGGGNWASPAPRNTSAEWQWLRCDTPFAAGCSLISRGSQSHRLDARDIGKWIAAARSVKFPANADCDPASECLLAVSATRGPVTATAPEPTPVPTPVVTPEPTPVPFVATPAPTPVPTQPAVVRAPAATLRTMRPQPTVRIRGTLTRYGARVSLFTVRAAKRARITVTCKGSGCPRKTYSTRQRTVRLRAFERYLPARTRIEVRVRRTGYYGKSTVLVIRRGKAPQRLDRCLSAGGAPTACPESR